MNPPQRDCLDAETLAAYLDGLLSRDAIGRADQHIDRCRTCRRELSALAATHSLPDGDSFVVIDGAAIEGRLGRYVVLRELGRGSMGIVVRAYDPALARAVAVKILTPRESEPSAARDRLRREAQAMARLTHPNVVRVYDVATHGDSLCIAMELVEGETLRGFVRTPRPWRETLAVCLLAGRGLAAAHAAKLVHGDYKPENVLVASDGRVAISDLGLAREDEDPVALAGTPAYMAPELFRGQPATAASDQFSYCVATYEALHGVRPFAGETVRDVRAQIVSGVQRDPPATSRVPAWLRGVLARGLATDPAERFASVPALLEQLEAGPLGGVIAWANRVRSGWLRGRA